MNPDTFRTLARYNRWANQRIYAAAADLSDAEYRADRGAFFKSIHGTLNHLLVADRIWLGRLNGMDHGVQSLDQILHDDRAELAAARAREDQRIIELTDQLNDAWLLETLVYADMKGQLQETPMIWVLGHLFNHQTHHRGQAHCLLSQAGQVAPPLDIIYFLREG